MLANLLFADRSYKTATNLETTKVVSTVRGRVHHIVCLNRTGNDLWLWPVDGIAKPANGAAPDFAPLKIPNGATGSYDFPNGHPFTTGLTVTVSSADIAYTEITATASVGCWFTVSYQERAN